MFSPEQLQPVCMGRVRMRVPSPTTVTYSKAMLSSINMTWQPMSSIGFLAAWGAHVEQLARSNERIERQVASPEQTLVVSHTTLENNPGFRSWEAWANHEDHTLVAKGDFGDEQDDVAQHWLKANLSGFRPDASTPGEGFCVPGGAIAAETNGETMDAQVDIKGPPFSDHPVLIDVSTDVMTIPATPALFKTTGAATTRLMKLTGGVHTLRHTDRRVAGQTGQEVVMLQKGSGGFGINAQFEFVGLASRRDAPYLHLSLDGNFPSSISSDQVLAVWDQVLTSLTFVK